MTIETAGLAPPLLLGKGPGFSMNKEKRENRYILGVDLGQSYDFSVLTILDAEFNNSGKLSYDLVYIKKFALKQSYLAVVEEIESVIEFYGLHGNYALVIDYTGVGHPVFDIFTSKGLNPMGVTITAGLKANQQAFNKVTVPKKDIVTYLQIVLQNRRIRIPKALGLLKELKQELLNFKFKVGANMKMTFGGSKGYHDDIVMALGVAIWFGEYHTKKKLTVIGG